MPVQQHLSTCFFASLQNSFPFFCCSQQHVFTSFPVSVHFIVFGTAAGAIVPMTNAQTNGIHFIIAFIQIHLLQCVQLLLYTLE
jgi:hypothetical protein